MNSPEKEKKEQEIYDSFFAESDHLKTLRPKPKQEWSDEDEVNKTRILESLEDQIRNADGVYYTKRLRTAQNWLKSLPERFNLQSKVKWSEKDERMKNRLIDRLNFIAYRQPTDATTVCMSFESEISWLKSLKPQSKIEWSEEDEKMRNAILGFLNPDKGGTKYSSNAELVEWSNWLKSLRPQSHWKPSEEQIYSLGTVVKGAGDVSVGSVGYNLKELYEQLKKFYSHEIH